MFLPPDMGIEGCLVSSLFFSCIASVLIIPLLVSPCLAVWPMDKMTVNRPHFRHVTDILIFHHFWQLLHFPAIIDISIHIKCLWVSPCVCNVFRPPHLFVPGDNNFQSQNWRGTNNLFVPGDKHFSRTVGRGDKYFSHRGGQTFLEAHRALKL